MRDRPRAQGEIVQATVRDIDVVMPPEIGRTSLIDRLDLLACFLWPDLEALCHNLNAFLQRGHGADVESMWLVPENHLAGSSDEQDGFLLSQVENQ